MAAKAGKVGVWMAVLWIAGTVPLVSTWGQTPTAGQSLVQTSDGFAIDRTALLMGVDRLIAPGALPGQVAALSPQAFVFITGAQGKRRVPLFAGTRADKGRAIACGHGGFFSDTSLANAGNARLLQNCISWLGGGRAPKSVRVGVLADGDASLVGALRNAGFAADAVKPADVLARKANYDVLCIGQAVLSREQAGRVAAWVRSGGGLLSFGPAWGWAQLNPDKELSADHTGNMALLPLGLAQTDATADPTGPSGTWLADEANRQASLSASAYAALDELNAYAKGGAKLSPARLAEVTELVSQAMSAVGDNVGAAGTYAARVRRLCTENNGAAIPSKEHPVGAEMPFARLQIALDAARLRHAPLAPATPHPAAAVFPGSVTADAPRAAGTVMVDTSVPEWHGTGFYAAPGETITVSLPPDARNRNLSVRIGAHKDGIWAREAWWRFPEITREARIKGDKLQIANPFGGTVYIVVPQGETKRGGMVSVTIAGAVAQPRFVTGQTTLEQWKLLRNAPAPWAEIEGKQCILTVPSSVVRDLDDPQAVADYWDRVMDAAADFYGISRNRTRPERYCVDVQISAGYMHSGYPIMTFDDVARRFVDVKELTRPGGNTWGFYHELGHNHQKPEWTWDGCGEVTNNLFSLRGSELFNAATSNYETSHNAIAPEPRRKRLEKYLADGAKYDDWKSDPFLALTLFIELRQAFGWEPFTSVFKQYENLPQSERPRTDEEKRSQFMVRFSRVVGHNLGPFFQAWGVPTSDKARASLADLPAWMPLDWPTKTASSALAPPRTTPIGAKL